MSPWHPHSVWTDERIERLRQLWCVEGWSAGVIAAELGISRLAVAAKARRMGLPPRKIRVRLKNPGSFAVRQPARQTASGAGSRLLSIDQLTGHTCRWPYGNPASPGFGYCGKFKELDGQSYCELHARRAYQKLPTNRQRKLAERLFSPTTDAWA